MKQALPFPTSVSLPTIQLTMQALSFLKHVSVFLVSSQGMQHAQRFLKLTFVWSHAL